jgi:hypothetical protein
MTRGACGNVSEIEVMISHCARHKSIPIHLLSPECQYIKDDLYILLRQILSENDLSSYKIMAEKFTRYDTAEYLKTDADMAAYLDACLEEAGDDPAFIAHALGIIARAHGM